mmetsp:Transcript_50799/g.126470  ORF Transcript_50799/g.126470 Transcript_50799/m.126470 type:complete len:433 (-) Transcript_50799:66-1364(-)
MVDEVGEGGGRRVRSWRGMRVAATLAVAMMGVIAVAVFGSGSNGRGSVELASFVEKAPEIQLAQSGSSIMGGSSGLQSREVQLDSVKPLLSSLGTSNLAAVSQAIESHRNNKLITLKAVPTQVTLTVPEDVTVQLSSLPGLDKTALASLSQLSQASDEENDRFDTFRKHFNSTQGHLFKKWGYQKGLPGVLPPSLWFLHDGWHKCRTGKSQSPIDIRPGHAKGGTGLEPLKWMCGKEACDKNKGKSTSRQAFDGHAFVVDSFGGDATPNLSGYTLEKMTLHTPSEHTLDGLHYDMEIQLLHRNKAGKVMVVSAFATAGAGNKSPSWLAGLASVVKPCLLAVDVTKCLLSDTPRHLTDSFSFRNVASSLAPLVNHYFSYEGSLTTPPCTEGVLWNVLRTPLSINQDDWTLFSALEGKNDRPTQFLRGRTVRWV